MPELPEVETIARGLRPVLVGRTIISMSIPGGHLIRQNQKLFQSKLIGRRILDTHRRGKILFLELDDDTLLAFHLRMTGRLGMAPTGRTVGKHVHLLLDLDNDTTLFFQDQRKFGTCGYYKAEELKAWPFYASLGPEPFALSARDFASMLKGRKGRIKALLLDQRFVAGIGNIYADESLFRARVHPATPANVLSPNKARRLHTAIQAVLHEAIAAGGSSIRDYRTASGLVGSFQNAFHVYGRGSQPCTRCGSLIQTAKVAGRTSSFCPRCQPLS